MQLIPCLLSIFRAGSNWVSIIVLIEIHQIETCACCSLVDVSDFQTMRTILCDLGVLVIHYSGN
jgi:hypothetical protein